MNPSTATAPDVERDRLSLIHDQIIQTLKTLQQEADYKQIEASVLKSLDSLNQKRQALLQTPVSDKEEKSPDPKPNPPQDPSLQASVGRRGKNLKPDVVLVQGLLNRRANSGLREDGQVGPATIAAIVDLQRRINGHYHRHDGRIDPKGPSWNWLIGSASLPPLPPVPPQPPIQPCPCPPVQPRIQPLPPAPPETGKNFKNQVQAISLKLIDLALEKFGNYEKDLFKLSLSHGINLIPGLFLKGKFDASASFHFRCSRKDNRLHTAIGVRGKAGLALSVGLGLTVMKYKMELASLGLKGEAQITAQRNCDWIAESDALISQSHWELGLSLSLKAFVDVTPPPLCAKEGWTHNKILGYISKYIPKSRVEKGLVVLDLAGLRAKLSSPNLLLSFRQSGDFSAQINVRAWQFSLETGAQASLNKLNLNGKKV